MGLIYIVLHAVNTLYAINLLKNVFFFLDFAKNISVLESLNLYLTGCLTGRDSYIVSYVLEHLIIKQ